MPLCVLLRGAVLFIGREAIRLERATSATTWIVTRAWLGTRARTSPRGLRSVSPSPSPPVAVSLSIAEGRDRERSRDVGARRARARRDLVCGPSPLGLAIALDRAPYARRSETRSRFRKGGMLSVANPGNGGLPPSVYTCSSTARRLLERKSDRRGSRSSALASPARLRISSSSASGA